MEARMKRVILMILDSLGIGAMPDADNYGDQGSNTLGSIVKAYKDFNIPHLTQLGMGNIDGVNLEGKPDETTASYGKAKEDSVGKDTITGHWEIAGLFTEKPFLTFEHFPESFIKAFEKAIGTEVMGNYPESGTVIISEFGEEHMKTGKPIVYTSADSVFQIAAHESIIPLERLYEICEIARAMLVDELQIGRVIARPFIGEPGNFKRTPNRKDYAVSPPTDTLLDKVKKKGQTVFAIGKIEDIFNGHGITQSVHTVSNMDGVDQTLKAMEQEFEGLIFTNLVDFDSLYGHRRDPVGYGKAIEDFDQRLPELMAAMKPEDVMILMADHGNDPSHTGYDHTREYVPVLIFGDEVKPNVNLHTINGFYSVGATIAEYLGIAPLDHGQSFLDKVSK